METHYLETIVERLDQGGRLELAATREGTSETVLYLREDYLGQPRSFSMATNSYSMSGTPVQARRYMKLYVYLPDMLHGELRDALLISYGVGSTARALTDTQSLERIDVVDISREILEMSAIVYPDPADHPLHDPRVEVHVEDGRYFLQTTKRRYDLITSEPPPPKAAGVVNLYTREYFELIHSRLRDGGVNSYWLPVHSLTDSDAKAIIRAYCDVFEDCSLWAGSGLDWMLVGSRDGRWHRDIDRFERPWRDPEVGRELKALGFERPEQIGALFMADANSLDELTRDVLPLIDDFPKRLSRERLDIKAAEATFAPWMNTDSARARFSDSPFIQHAWPPELIEASLPYFEIQSLINGLGLKTRGQASIQESVLHDLLTETSLETLVLWQMHVDHVVLGILDDHLAEGGDPSPHLAILATRAIAERRYAEAVDFLARASIQRPDDSRMFFLRLFALCMDGRTAEAEALIAGVVSRLPTDTEASLYWQFMGETFGLRGPDEVSAAPLAKR
jgi:spermidine synthase